MLIPNPRFFRFCLGLGLLWWPPAWAQGVPDSELVRYQERPQVRVFDGVVEAVRQSTVSAETSGTVQSIAFDVDDYVEAGAVLLRIKDTRQRAAVDDAQARYNEASKEYERIQKVFAKGAVSRAELDKVTANLKSALSRLKDAQEELAHTVVRAPYSGIVTKRLVEPGETATPGKPLMEGVSLEELRVTAQVPQSVINQVRVHRQAWAVVDGARGRRVAVQNLTIFPYANVDTHTFTVRGLLPAGGSGLFPGMFVKLHLVIGKARRLVAPAVAVVRRSEVTAVYVLGSTDRVAFLQVRVGRSWPGEGLVEVLAGLHAGDRVLLDPVRAGILLKTQREGEAPDRG